MQVEGLGVGVCSFVFSNLALRVKGLGPCFKGHPTFTAA